VPAARTAPVASSVMPARLPDFSVQDQREFKEFEVLGDNGYLEIMLHTSNSSSPRFIT